MATHDPFATAVEEAEKGNVLYGQIQIDDAYMYLNKGESLRHWIEGQDPISNRVSELSFTLTPLAESGLTKLIRRTMLAMRTSEFAKIVWPSLRDTCGVKSKDDVHNQFVKVEMVKNGRTWTNDQGEQREGTTFKFLAIYTDEAACIKAYYDDGNRPRQVEQDDTGAMAIDMSENGRTPAPEPTHNPEKEVAEQLLKVLIKQANGNKDALARSIGSMPQVNKFFTVESPEVVSLMAA